MDNRRSKENYYLDIAEAALERSTCLRRQFGAIIVRDDEIVATGYNGAPRGRRNCSDLGRCTRRELNIPAGERYELCRSVHAEANAIISAARRDMMGATLYLVGRDTATGGYYPETTPCAMCSSSTPASRRSSAAPAQTNTRPRSCATGCTTTIPSAEKNSKPPPFPIGNGGGFFTAVLLFCSLRWRRRCR